MQPLPDAVRPPGDHGLANAMRSDGGNFVPGDLYPDYPALIVRHGLDGERELALARWGMPSSKKALFDATTKRAPFGKSTVATG